jgi:hypothetical protein
MRNKCVAILLASTWLIADCQRAHGASECPKECGCSGGIRSCSYHPSDEDLEGYAAVSRIPALALRKLGSIQFADPLSPNLGLTINKASGASKDDRSLLAGVSAVGVDAIGRIFVVDASTGAEHVFDDSGRQLWAGTPSASIPAPSSHHVETIKITSSGEAWVVSRKSNGGSGSESKLEYVHYGQSGQPTAIKSITFEGRTVRHWLPQPEGRLRWMFTDEKFFLDTSGAPLRAIAWPGRAGFGDYLRSITAVAPDGSLAVAAVRDRPGIARGVDLWNWYAALYSPKGVKITDWPFPFKLYQVPRIAFDGRHIALIVPLNYASGEETIVVADTQGHPLFRADVHPDGSNDKMYLVARATGDELWIYGDGQITRYAMPR